MCVVELELELERVLILPYLYYIVLYCSALHSTIVCRTIPLCHSDSPFGFYRALHYIVLYCTTLYYTVLHCTALYRNLLYEKRLTIKNIDITSPWPSFTIFTIFC